KKREADGEDGWSRRAWASGHLWMIAMRFAVVHSHFLCSLRPRNKKRVVRQIGPHDPACLGLLQPLLHTDEQISRRPLRPSSQRPGILPSCGCGYHTRKEPGSF